MTRSTAVYYVGIDYVGIDIGRTFTDTVVVDEAVRVKMYKAPIPPENRSIGVRERRGAVGRGLEPLPRRRSAERRATGAAGEAAAGPGSAGVPVSILGNPAFGVLWAAGASPPVRCVARRRCAVTGIAHTVWERIACPRTRRGGR